MVGGGKKLFADKQMLRILTNTQKQWLTRTTRPFTL
jgi:hypothetical protein